jgi:hypothetical protein
MKFLNGFISFLLMGLALIGVFYLQEGRFEQRKKVEGDSFFIEEKSVKTFLDIQGKMPSFGFDNVVADWNFLQFIQYFGDTNAREKTGYSLIPEFFEIMVKKDPRFTRAYLILSPSNSLYAIEPEITVDLLKKVLQKVSPQTDPLASFVWIYKGVDEMLFLGDTKAAENSYRMAANWVLISHGKSGQKVAQRLLETAQFLAKNPDSRKARISAWTTVLSGAIDEQTQQRAIKEIRSLGGQVKVTFQGKLEITFPEKD